MNWVVISFVLFISSVLLYLTVRKAQVSGLSDQLQNLSMFAIPAVFYLALILLTKQSFLIPFSDLVVVFLTAIFLSYLGNVFSLEGIRLSPNPGYSLMISKSYVIFTTLVAVFLFRSELTVKGVLAITIIVFSSALISIPTRVKNALNKGSLWLAYSLGAFFCWGSLALVSKFILSNRGLNVIVYLFYLTLFVTILISTEVYLRKARFALTKASAQVFFLIGIFSLVFNLSMQSGYIFAPNPGYINAVNASSISLLTLLSAFFFKDEFSLRKFLGVVGATVGLILLFL